MGLFSFLGKVVKGAVGVAANLATGNPIGALKAGAGTVGSLLGHKAPYGHTATKINVLGTFGPRAIPILRGNATQAMPGSVQAIRATPIMPGGAISTPRGMMPKSGGTPPAQYGSGSSSSHGKRRKRKRRSTSARRSSRTRSSGKRRRGGRKLKFGSPAWRKKYLGHR